MTHNEYSQQMAFDAKPRAVAVAFYGEKVYIPFGKQIGCGQEMENCVPVRYDPRFGESVWGEYFLNLTTMKLYCQCNIYSTVEIEKDSSHSGWGFASSKVAKDLGGPFWKEEINGRNDIRVTKKGNKFYYTR